MRRKVLWSLPISLLLLASCAQPDRPLRVAKSLYLNKRYMKFEVENGPSYRDVPLKDGSTMHYWRSDYGNLIAIATGRDDNYPDYCELALKTDRNKVVREIYILENSVLCGPILQ